MALPVMSPLVPERIWALPIGAASVKFYCYLVFRGEDGGVLPSQKQMAAEYGVTPTTVSTLLEPLFDLKIVLRSSGESGRRGNRYRLHPLAVRYDSDEAMKAAVAQAFVDMKAGRLPGLQLPEYKTAPPAAGGQTGPKLRIA
ncbi:hypothetical protein ACFYXM_12045 [Streptomyces sp. NPDC002476]|uniref:hypothetical protein n=1 Tax=Streptomyces sp. NPDC002476 TaxID=3364648 RepID=UPI00367E4E5D